MPRIGLLSDSHGRASTTQRAVDLLASQGAEILIHLGDVGSIDVIDALIIDPTASKGPREAHLVFGNVDQDIDGMGKYAREVSVQVDHPVGRLTWDGKTLVFMHGDDETAYRQALAEGVTYLCHGHTHRTTDTREGQTRIINPGALQRAKQYTVALLDTASDTLTFHPVDRAG